MLTRLSTGIPTVDVQADFARARRSHLALRVLGTRRPRAPRVLDEACALPSGTPQLRVIRLDEIVGTVEPSPMFDARFRPASELVRRRWERVALAFRTGVGLPPIRVRRAPDGYYVIDGRHRVSVALALGHRDIDAWVTETGALACAA
jgi:ParB-like nuclease domain